MEIAIKEEIIDDNTISLENYHIKSGAIFYFKPNNDFSFFCTLCQKTKCENLEKLRNHLEYCTMDPSYTFNLNTNLEITTKSESNSREPKSLSNIDLIKEEANDGNDNNIKCGEVYYSKSCKVVALACTLCTTEAFTIFDEFSIHSLNHLQHDEFGGEDTKTETDNKAQSVSDVQVYFTQSLRGKPAIMADGIRFLIMSENKNKILWRCSYMATKKIKCPARITMLKEDPPRFGINKSEHVHAELKRNKYCPSRNVSTKSEVIAYNV